MMCGVQQQKDERPVVWLARWWDKGPCTGPAATIPGLGPCWYWLHNFHGALSHHYFKMHCHFHSHEERKCLKCVSKLVSQLQTWFLTNILKRKWKNSLSPTILLPTTYQDISSFRLTAQVSFFICSCEMIIINTAQSGRPEDHTTFFFSFLNSLLSDKHFSDRNLTAVIFIS